MSAAARRRARRTPAAPRRGSTGGRWLLGLAGTALLAWLALFGPRSEGYGPRTLTPGDLDDVIEISRTDRVGGLLQARLASRPAPGDEATFDAAIEIVCDRALEAGYDSILVLAPDGTALVSGDVLEPRLAPLDEQGT